MDKNEIQFPKSEHKNNHGRTQIINNVKNNNKTHGIKEQIKDKVILIIMMMITIVIIILVMSVNNKTT